MPIACMYGPDAFCKRFLVMRSCLRTCIRLACWAALCMPAASMRFAHPALSSSSARASAQPRGNTGSPDAGLTGRHHFIAHRKPARCSVLSPRCGWYRQCGTRFQAGAATRERGRYARSLLSKAWMILAFLFANSTAARLKPRRSIRSRSHRLCASCFSPSHRSTDRAP